MKRYKFCGAFEGEDIVFGAERPGYPSKDVDEHEVMEWIDYMKRNGIKRVVCLLPDEQLEYYNVPLLEIYEREFGKENVLWAPIKDFHLCDKDTLKKILRFLKDADTKGEKMVVHCSGGLGRTGHVLCAWLVFGRGFSVKDAIYTVMNTGRDPYEAVRRGNADERDLIDLLKWVSTLELD